MNSTVKEGSFSGREKEGARKAILGEVEGSIAGEWTQKLCRTICRVLVSLQVWPNLK